MKKLKSPKIKMTSEERRLSIIQASIYVFGQRGFHGTYVKDIAKAAGISEALLFRHFSGKKDLYMSIGKYMDADLMLVLDLFKNKEPSGKMLVELVYCLIVVQVTYKPRKTKKREAMERLMIYSYLENPQHLKNIFSMFNQKVGVLWDKSMEAAKKNNELKDNFKLKNSLWLIHLLASSINFSNATGVEILPYKGKYKEFVDETIQFALMATGLKDEVIEKYYKPEVLQKMLPDAY